MPNRTVHGHSPDLALDAPPRIGGAIRSPSGTRTTRALAVLSALLVAAACGAAGNSGDADSGDDGLSSVAGSPQVVDSAATGGLDAIASTTVPVPLDQHGCAGAAVEVVERILIERRIGGDAPICLPAGHPAAVTPSTACWSTCTDGRVFVDFDLDTTRAAVQRMNEATGEVETVVPFAARYATGDGTTTTAESLVLIPSETPREWEFVALVEVDLAAQKRAAAALAGRYLDAIGRGDYRTAAELMITDPADPSVARDDLGRLADEGMLAGTSPTQIAAALEQWCASGAACTVEPSLEVEVTAGHEVRVIATYELTDGTYETTFAFDDGSIHGLPLKVN